MQYFTENNIGSDGAKSIAEALKINQTITFLSVHGMIQIITLSPHHHHTKCKFHR